MIEITMLLENTAARGDMAAEHGLSLHIKAGGRSILFDMGQTGAFADNAKTLGVDLAAVDTAILSHGHYDHGGGLARFLEINDHAPVYVSRHAFGGYYSGGGAKYIGLDPALRESGRLVLTGDVQAIGGGMTLLSCNDRPAAYPMSGRGLTALREGEHAPDDFKHEQYLVMEDGARRVVISGCSHKGVLNIVRWLEPDVLIGGFHYKGLDMQGADGAMVDKAAQQLLASGADFYTCHCTGEEAFVRMKAAMGDRLTYLSGGMRIAL